jgi:hypothetical protein
LFSMPSVPFKRGLNVLKSLIMYSLGLFLRYVVWIGFVAIVLYGVYRILSALLDRYLVAKRDHTAALREQNQTLKQIASALDKPGDSTNNDYK